MEDDYGKIAEQIVELIEQVPTKRYGEINLVLAKEIGLMLISLSSIKSAFYHEKLEQIIKKLAFGREDKTCKLTKEENETIKELVR